MGNSDYLNLVSNDAFSEFETTLLIRSLFAPILI